MHTRTVGAGIAAAVAILALCADSYGQSKSEKRGVAFGYHSVADMNAMKPGISWWYNWSPQPDAGVAGTFPNSEVAFMPMVWGGSFTVADIVSKIPNGAQYLLTFNEPNFVPQAHLTPQQMASLWPQIEQIAAQKNLKIVGPAVNFCGGSDCTLPGVTDPVVYLDQFFAACSNCKIDYVAIHWYACTPEALTSYLGNFKKYGKPIWMTEFACWEGTPTLDQQKTYMPLAVDILEKDPMVFRYSWFSGDRANTGSPYVSLYAPASGQLTELGQLYKSLPFTTGTPTATRTPAPTATATATTRPRATGTATARTTATPTTGGSPTMVNLSSAFNVNVAYTDGTTFPSNGGIDGVGSAYSATLLGASLTWSGTTFSLGPSNQLNGVRNRTVSLPAGQYTTLLLLGTGVNGDQVSQAVRVTYTDGTSAMFTQTFSNWLSASQNVAGQTVAKSMAYRNKSTGVKDSRVFNLYGYSFALDSTKTVSVLVLPASNNVSILAATLGH
jgi:Glycosyl hydrolase catalytic core